LPLTGAVPTVAPPLVQLAGAVACGPNTVKVIVPVAPLLAPDKVELIELAVIACPAVAEAGAATLVEVAFVTMVLIIALPQAELDGGLVPSPL
jgi:hypothetical protein